MLSLKLKRTAPAPDEAHGVTWAGPSSIPADDPHSVPVTTRELRTRAELPTAPPVPTLFSRESTPPQQTLAIWDPSGSWPGFSILQLALAAHGRISEITLVQEQQPDTPVARLRSTVLPTPSGQPLGVLEVEASFNDPRGLSVALTLLEQADRAVILAGSNADKDLIRRIGDVVRPDSWTGPSLLLVSPADKPSRADRLRRAGWPRGMKMHVLELFAVNDPGWSQQLIALVTGYASGEPTVPAPIDPPAPEETAAMPVATPPGVAPTPSPSRPPVAPPAAVPVTSPAPTGPAATGPLPDFPDASARRVLDVLALGVGVSACAVVAVDDARLLALHAQTEDQQALLESAARAGCAMWRAHRALGAGQPMHEMSWGAPHHHHLLLALPRRPDLLLLACVEREFGDLAAVRWQATVARNQWR